MHILLTDLLSCPRCGPEFGLIVLADQVADRRVASGSLGCANCREQYPITDAVADLRPAAAFGGAVGEGSRGGGPDDADRALRMAALLGLGEDAGTVLVVGAAPGLVREIGDLLPNGTVVGASRASVSGLAGDAEWLLLGERYPFRSGSLRGVVLTGEAAREPLSEAARVLARDARLVLDPAPPQTDRRVAAAGLQLLLDQDGTAVASNSPPR